MTINQGANLISRDFYGVHILVFWASVVIAVGVFGAIIYSIFRHRHSKNIVKNFHKNIKVELLWTIIPIFIVIGMAVPASKILIDLKNTFKANTVVKNSNNHWK